MSKSKYPSPFYLILLAGSPSVSRQCPLPLYAAWIGVTSALSPAYFSQHFSILFFFGYDAFELKSLRPGPIVGSSWSSAATPYLGRGRIQPLASVKFAWRLANYYNGCRYESRKPVWFGLFWAVFGWRKLIVALFFLLISYWRCALAWISDIHLSCKPTLMCVSCLKI